MSTKSTVFTLASKRIGFCAEVYDEWFDGRYHLWFAIDKPWRRAQHFDQRTVRGDIPLWKTPTGRRGGQIQQ